MPARCLQRGSHSEMFSPIYDPVLSLFGRNNSSGLNMFIPPNLFWGVFKVI